MAEKNTTLHSCVLCADLTGYAGRSWFESARVFAWGIICAGIYLAVEHPVALIFVVPMMATISVRAFVLRRLRKLVVDDFPIAINVDCLEITVSERSSVETARLSECAWFFGSTDYCKFGPFLRRRPTLVFRLPSNRFIPWGNSDDAALGSLKESLDSTEIVHLLDRSLSSEIALRTLLPSLVSVIVGVCIWVALPFSEKVRIGVIFVSVFASILYSSILISRPLYGDQKNTGWRLAIACFVISSKTLFVGLVISDSWLVGLACSSIVLALQAVFLFVGKYLLAKVW